MKMNDRRCRPRIHVTEWYEPFREGVGKPLAGRQERIHCDSCGAEIYRGMVRCFCNREIEWDDPVMELECVDAESPESVPDHTLRGAPYLGVDADLDEWAEEKA